METKEEKKIYFAYLICIRCFQSIFLMQTGVTDVYNFLCGSHSTLKTRNGQSLMPPVQVLALTVLPPLFQVHIPFFSPPHSAIRIF